MAASLLWSMEEFLGPVMVMEDKDRYNITARMVLRVKTLYKWRDIILGGPDVEW